MNLYSEKINGSIEAVEKEAPVAKEQKRKLPAKKSSKKVDKEPLEATEENQIVPTIEQESEQNYEDLVEALEALSDDTNEPVSEIVRPPTPEPTLEPVEVKKRKRQPSVSKKSAPSTPANTPEPEHDAEPPKWFMKYVESMKTFQNEVSDKKRTKKVVKNEANDYAKEQWKKPEVRQKVTDNVDSHLTKMYRQIFSRG